MKLEGLKMKVSRELIRYHMHLYWKTNKWVMPFLVWFLSMVVSYSIKPVQVGASILVSSGIGFFIALWIGITYYETVDPVAEQITILKVQRRTTYDVSQVLFFAIMAIIIGVLGVVYPLLYNCYVKFELYTRSLQISDVIGSFWIHTLVASLGLMSSMLFQPRIFKNRKKAILSMACVGVVALAKTGMAESTPMLRLILWIFPPLADILKCFGKQDYFSFVDLLLWTAVSLIYMAVIFVVSELILNKKNNY